MMNKKLLPTSTDQKAWPTSHHVKITCAPLILYRRDWELLWFARGHSTLRFLQLKRKTARDKGREGPLSKALLWSCGPSLSSCCWRCCIWRAGEREHAACIFQPPVASVFRLRHQKCSHCALTSVAQLVGASAHKPKGHWLDSQSGHMPGLQVESPVGACAGGNWRMFLSYTDVSLSLPCPLSRISEHVPRWG